MEIETIRLNEIRKTKKNIYHMFPFACEVYYLKMNNSNVNQVLLGLSVLWGRKGGGEVGVNMVKDLYTHV
jgi:hypothetical protein